MVDFPKLRGNQQPRQEPTLTRPSPVDLDKIAKDIEKETAEFRAPPPGLAHLKYAPPSVRDAAARIVQSPDLDDHDQQLMLFAELPSKEIDEIIAKAEADMVELKRHGNAVKKMYKEHTEVIQTGYQRLRDGIKLSMKMFDDHRDNCTKLNEAYSKSKIIKEEEEEPKGDDTTSDNK